MEPPFNLVEAARFELASLTIEVRSLYMLSPFFIFPSNFERTQFQRVSPLRVSSNPPRTRGVDQPAVDAWPHPADEDEQTVAVIRRLAGTPWALRRAHALGSCF